MECQKCKKVLSRKGSHFMCQGPCQGTFHKGCVKGLAADIKAGKDRIYCNNCEEEDEDSESEEIEEDSQNLKKMLKDIQKKVSVLPSLIKQLDTIKDSMNLLSDKYDNLVAEQDQAKTKINKLEKTVSTINNKCVYLEKCNIALEQKVHEFEQATRQNNIEIVGVEQIPGENIKEVVKKIGSIMEVCSDDIAWCKRKQTRNQSNKPASIMVWFKTTGTATRDSWLAQRRKLVGVTSKNITEGKNMDRIYVNEDLTTSNKSLLWNAKKQLKGIFKYIWVSNARILVKKDEGDKSAWIRSESDINELLTKK
ncbi:uncharacterized protein LOC113233006 [Hyposmocoma kahamanoa]|uniref:uncharacterized protein LOC113233006 n=1 Tax=Hyposmocoma kahamanoa TaxID=1477025 RepID=UPI000E6D735D|nr:uncharacterized protein LOC113233006 [Hyposmocoma kahamanoa]